ncbi:MAG: hypothetical protein INF91_11600 [Alphaproteobacteria bacterium]|nr:hypothetical protein [Alphaproteobacteria bacterium]
MTMAVKHSLRFVPQALDPATELMLAATLVVLGSEARDGHVPAAWRERLKACALGLPAEGLPAAWHSLADLSLRWCRDHDGEPRSPRFPALQPLIERAHEAGVPVPQAWQEIHG